MKSKIGGLMMESKNLKKIVDEKLCFEEYKEPEEGIIIQRSFENNLSEQKKYQKLLPLIPTKCYSINSSNYSLLPLTIKRCYK